MSSPSHQRKHSNPYLFGNNFGQSSSSPSSTPQDGSATPSNATQLEASHFLLSFLVTPSERIAIHKQLSRLNLISPPQFDPSNSTGSTAPNTPFQSNPSTPLASGGPLSFTEAKPTNNTTTTSQISSLARELQKDLPPLNSKAAWFNDNAVPLTTRTAIRAFLWGYSINTALETLLPALLKKKSPSEAFKSLASRTSARVGLALSVHTLLYRLLLFLLVRLRIQLLTRLPSLAPSSLQEQSFRSRTFARFVRILRSNLLAPFLAAFLASNTSGNLLPSTTTSISGSQKLPSNSKGSASFPRRALALYFLTKGIQAAFLEARRSDAKVISWVPTWLGGALWYAIGNGQLLWTFLFEPDCFPAGYGNIILSRSSSYIPPKPSHLPKQLPWPAGREVVDTIARLSTPTSTTSAFPSFTSPLLSALTPNGFPSSSHPSINPILDFAPAHPAHTKLLCAVLHPKEPDCSKNFIKFFTKEWSSSAKFVAIFATITNLIGWKKVLKNPDAALFKYALSIVQGATVISGSIGAAWGLTCFFQHYLPNNFLPRSRFFLNGFLSSIFILAFPQQRRSEVGLYVARMSMQSSWDVLKKRGKVKSVRNGDVFLLSFGLALLTCLYESRPKAVSPAIRSALLRICGPRLASLQAEAEARKKKKQEHTFNNATSMPLNLPEKNGKRVRKARFDL